MSPLATEDEDEDEDEDGMPGAGETRDAISPWTVDSLHEHMTKMIAEVDRRYEQRFVAQEKAVEDAFVAAEKAVNAALLAAHQAVEKAEVAGEKRFDSVNEFRGQLADQAATFIARNEAEARLTANSDKIEALRAQCVEQGLAYMPRVEAEARVRAATAGIEMLRSDQAKMITRDASDAARDSIIEKVDSLTKSITNLTSETIGRGEADARFHAIQALTDSNRSRLDKLEGKSTGMNASWAILVGMVGLVATAAAIIAAVISAAGH